MNAKLEKLFKILSTVLFALYIFLLIWVVVFKCGNSSTVLQTYTYFKNYSLEERFNFNLVPFSDYYEGPFVSQRDIIIKDDILNVALFVIMGVYVTYFSKKHRLLKAIIVSFLFSAFFELFQLFTIIGSFSTKDMITNTFGGIIGYIICRLLYREKNSTIKLMIFNIISILAVIVFLPVAGYALMSIVKSFDVFVDIILKRV